VFDLKGKKGLILGIANTHSIAYGCAKAFTQAGAEIGMTYGRDKTRTYVEPIAEELNADFLKQCDVSNDDAMEDLFAYIRDSWGRIDFVLHSIAFAPRDDLHGPVINSSREGFTMAMDISCHSFARTARLARPLMTDGGSLLTVSYYGGEKVVDHYSIMGPVKAALESTTRYLAAELGEDGISVNALSPGPILTRASSGIKEFDHLADEAIEHSPEHRLVTIEEVGAYAAFLVSDGARSITGDVCYVDAGRHIML